jgi:CheY-like chemotaxis protein
MGKNAAARYHNFAGRPKVSEGADGAAGGAELKLRALPSPPPAVNPPSRSMRLTILYVEDHKVVSDAVSETLGYEGWRVEVCADGLAGLSLIEGRSHYDLLMLDNELPGASGLELARRARELTHRARTPIIVFSASEVGREAREAGADLFLKKPDDVKTLADTIRRLLDVPA